MDTGLMHNEPLVALAALCGGPALLLAAFAAVQIWRKFRRR